MLSYPHFRKFVTLRNGQGLLLRPITNQDADYLVRLIGDSGAAGLPRREGQEVYQLLENLATPLNYLKLLPLAAVSLDGHCFAGCGLLTRSGQPTPYLGEISLLVSRAYGGLEVEACLLKELIRLAGDEDLAVLKARVGVKAAHMLRAFQEQGFQVGATVRDFPEDQREGGGKVFIMMRPLARLRPPKDLP
jgi:hypothetical protein